jgi:hypothetical protein
MNSKGEIVCGVHNVPWCPVCSDQVRKDLAIEVGLPHRAPATQSPVEESRVRRELASLGLGSPRRGLRGR